MPAIKTIQEAFASLSDQQLRRVRTVLGARVNDLDRQMNRAVPIGSLAQHSESDLRYRNELSEILNKLYEYREDLRV